jgi:diguanylate cyclase (GGDEF)-like protein
MAALPALLAATTPFTGLLFTLDAANRYVRGPVFPVFAVFQFALVLLSFVPVVAGRGKTSPRIYVTLLLFPLPMVLAAVGQFLFYGLVLIWPATTIFLVAAALNIQRIHASTDYLTGAATRGRLDEAMEKLARGGKGFGGLLVDLNDFKPINDALGHSTGDKALEEAVGVLRTAVRTDDLVARLGGDEFVLIVEGAGEEVLAEVKKRIERNAEALNALPGRPYRISFSIGSGVYDGKRDGTTAKFVSRLDAAMYEDKKARKAVR